MLERGGSSEARRDPCPPAGLPSLIVNLAPALIQRQPQDEEYARNPIVLAADFRCAPDVRGEGVLFSDYL
jgi:hypothetical protein